MITLRAVSAHDERRCWWQPNELATLPLVTAVEVVTVDGSRAPGASRRRARSCAPPMPSSSPRIQAFQTAGMRRQLVESWSALLPPVDGPLGERVEPAGSRALVRTALRIFERATLYPPICGPRSIRSFTASRMRCLQPR